MQASIPAASEQPRSAKHISLPPLWTEADGLLWHWKCMWNPHRMVRVSLACESASSEGTRCDRLEHQSGRLHLQNFAGGRETRPKMPELREWGACCSRHSRLQIGMQRRPCARLRVEVPGGRLACALIVYSTLMEHGFHLQLQSHRLPHEDVASCPLPALPDHTEDSIPLVGWLDVSDEAQTGGERYRSWKKPCPEYRCGIPRPQRSSLTGRSRHR
jgi:hypothetical protein